MRRVEIRDRPLRIWIERVLQPAADQADVLIADQGKSDARRGRGHVDRFRERVVQVELQPVAELLAQRRLQSIEIRVADRTPRES